MSTNQDTKKLKKELREAIAAHNRGADITYNENYNVMHKLGSMVTRGICRRVSQGIDGTSNSKISWKDMMEWSRSMLPVGAGYKDQDTTESLKPYVDLLRDEYNKG